ncbi:MAG: gliding motility lipoprotein GldH [Tannerella sp.]|jgi:gliding motility-associated lipoprotein GldH|nr:gliding motility lipoprotein GldH [Tannerella sp.]
MQPEVGNRSNRIKPLVRRIVMPCLLAVCLSCTGRIFYERYQVVEHGWSKEKEYFFTYEIRDNSVPYRLSLEIRNNSRYPYQNLWLFYSEEQPVGPVLLFDTLECMLADDHGKWLGRGISIHHSSIPVRTHFRFPHKGQYTFCVRHGMRDTYLNGIEEIGLHIEVEKEEGRMEKEEGFSP